MIVDSPTSDLKARFKAIRAWKRASRRAPHKPLLLLLALGRVQRGEHRLVRFNELEDRLGALLDAFGPARGKHQPDLSFWHLCTDKLWEIPSADELPRHKGGKRPFLEPLRAAVGGFPREIHTALKHNPKLVAEIAGAILAEHFPPSYHQRLRADVGLTLHVFTTSTRRKRDPEFSKAVLAAYEHRCAVCGLDAALDGKVIGLEAAHVHWHCHDGPDTLDNGLCLCRLHHGALDDGAIGLNEDSRVMVSGRVAGGDAVEAMIGRFHGGKLRGPATGHPSVGDGFRRWHMDQVFKG